MDYRCRQAWALKDISLGLRTCALFGALYGAIVPAMILQGQKNHSRKADQLGKHELTLPMNIVHEYMYSYALAGEFGWLSKIYIVTYVRTVELLLCCIAM